MQPEDDDGRASPAGHRDSIFDFGPGFAALQPKPSARSSASSRSTTPRNVIAPDATELPPPTATPRRPVVPRLPLLSSRTLNPNAVPASARKYTVAAQDESVPSSQKPQPQRERPRARPSLVTLLQPQRSAAALARSSTRAFAAASAQQLVAFALLLAALLSESAAPAPRHNAPLGALLFAQPVTAFPHRAAVSGLGAAALCDVFWLLRPQERAFNGSIRADWLAFSQLTLAACALLKLWLVFAAYFDLHALESDADYEDAAPLRAPPMPSHRLWDQLKVLFPRKTLPRRADLSFEVLRRVLALVWLHGVAALVLLLIAGIAALKFATRPQFRAAPLGVSLPLALVLKAATTLLAFLAATHRMSYAGCLRVAGCPLGRSALKEPVMHYNKRWVTRLARTKALDAAVGFYALAVLFAAAHRGEGVATRGVTALLVAAALVLLVLELWVPLLVLTAAKCGAQLHALHRRGARGVDHPLAPTQLAWSDSDSDGDSSDDSDSSEDSSDDGEASSGSSGSEDEDRSGSTRIVDAADARTAGEAVWVRHWDAASNRAFLAHSVTGETVWEIRKAAADEDNGDEQFRAQWLALPDAGGFVCRVARLPTAKDLAAHLGRQRFAVASDVVDAASHRRVVRFAAADAATPFLGELALDSLSLKLHAAFRCADAAAVVDIVRRLRLKDIVGDYAPCEP